MRIGIDASPASLRGSGTGRYAALLVRSLLDVDEEMNREEFRRYRIAPLPSRFPAWVLDALTRLWHVARLLAEEARARVRLAPGHRWRAWRHGFTAQSYVLYGLATRPVHDYLSDVARTRTHRINGPFNHLFRNKLVFGHVMERFGVPQAPAHALLHRGSVQPLDASPPSDQPAAWLRELLDREGRLVLKPAFGGMGTGLLFLDSRDGEVTVNGVDSSLDAACELIDPLEPYLVAGFVEQGAYAARVYARTTNTIRLLTLWDDVTGAPFVAAAAHRFGTARSFPVDNFHAGWGGLSARLDVETGELGAAITLSTDGRVCGYEQHPESGAPIRGVRVPFWSETVAVILRAATHLAYAPAIGWDLVITDRGGCCLEANSPPGPAVWQVHQPLLADMRVRRFYQRHHII